MTPTSSRHGTGTVQWMEWPEIPLVGLTGSLTAVKSIMGILLCNMGTVIVISRGTRPGILVSSNISHEPNGSEGEGVPIIPQQWE